MKIKEIKKELKVSKKLIKVLMTSCKSTDSKMSLNQCLSEIDDSIKSIENDDFDFQELMDTKLSIHTLVNEFLDGHMEV